MAVITRKTVEAAAARGDTEVSAPPGTVVTPEARDRAAQLGIRLGNEVRGEWQRNVPRARGAFPQRRPTGGGGQGEVSGVRPGAPARSIDADVTRVTERVLALLRSEGIRVDDADVRARAEEAIRRLLTSGSISGVNGNGAGGPHH
jgi:hypothetical protein